MGREARMVTKDWEHPTNEDGKYIPLEEWDFDAREKEWNEGWEQWQKGMYRRYKAHGWEWVPIEEEDKHQRYTEWGGRRPSPDDYMPNWKQEEKTHIQMYEDTSEGTPISPVMETPEELARWLADNGASSFGDMTSTYEQWLPVCRGGFAPSMVIDGGRVMSGVEALSATREESN